MKAILRVALLSLCAATNASAQQPVLVSGDWLLSRLSRPSLVVLHVAGSRAEYDAGHIPGARYLPFAAIAPMSEGLNVQMPPLAQIDSVLESVGVSDGQHVILYGQPMNVARAFVTLEHVGLRGSVSVVDGGMDQWREARRPISREPVSLSTGSFTPNRIDNIVDAAWIQSNGTKARTRILDARAPEFYLGLSPGSTARAGHIPGAQNLPFSAVTGELTTIRGRATLRGLFHRAGVADGDTVVTYCHIGMQASVLYLGARVAGLPAKLYDGSWEDWAKRSELPIVKAP